ncbi:Transcription elongation factor spt6 [Sarracenia purpurea var. burkii]
MVAALCGPGREILSWKLCPLESFLTADEKYQMVEQVMVDVTNQVGLDVNLAIAHEWLFSPLQFISGLGPRKAASLQRSLVRAGSIYTRKDFLTAHGLGKKVFVNAVGFLRIRRTGLAASSSQFINLLDDTRIHPESYGLAQELAKDIYIADMQDGGYDDEDVLEMAIEHVREKPDLLKYFDVDEYVKSKKWENKRETLDNIRLELIQGFQEWRRQYVEPSQDEEFYMISGETDVTLAEGRIVQATVRRAQPQKAICSLESGLTGVLTREDYTDDGSDDIDLSERLHVGDILTCRIKSIQMNRYQIFLTCRESEMKSNRYQNQQNMDPFYHEGQNSSQCAQEKARKENELAKKHFKPRMIDHPRFQNTTADEATEFLSYKDPGESIFRPSSRGPSYLTLTLKVFDGVYAHKDIIEDGKEHKDVTSLLRIGKTLKIGEDTFADLDEVMNRYVDPLVTHLKTMLSFRKFKKGTKSEVDELLRIEKSEHPNRIVYCFGISHEHPGIFILTYIRTTNPRHEYIGLYPKGFKFRKNMFDDIGRLVAFFQRHIDDPQPMDRDRNSTPSSQSGRGDYRNGGNRDGHPSGLPRPDGGRGRGRGRGRGSGSYNSGEGNSTGNDRQDSDYGSQKWGAKDGDDGGWVGGGSSGFGGNSGDGGGSNWSSGSGGGWGSSGGSSGWGKGSGGTGSGGADANAENSGWGSHGSGKGKESSGGTGSGDANAGSSGWGSGRNNSGGSDSGSGWGSSGGGSGWGKGSGGTGSGDANAEKSGWGSHGSGKGKGISATGSGDANAGNSGWGSGGNNSGGSGGSGSSSGWGKGSGGGTGSGDVEANTKNPGWGSSNSGGGGGSGWGKGGSGGTGSGDVDANAGTSGWGSRASDKGKGSSGGTGPDDVDGNAGKSSWGSGNSKSGGSSWGKGNSSGTGSGDVDANAGNSGWGASKGSSVPDKSGWSGSSGW